MLQVFHLSCKQFQNSEARWAQQTKTGIFKEDPRDSKELGNPSHCLALMATSCRAFYSGMSLLSFKIWNVEHLLNSCCKWYYNCAVLSERLSRNSRCNFRAFLHSVLEIMLDCILEVVGLYNLPVSNDTVEMPWIGIKEKQIHGWRVGWGLGLRGF